ncbi:MAG TPA: glycosyltransferase family 39 protein [Rhizomicrobium sp.]|nr:glycosyltransferase family 39 protein [Rhizomicrobium sp.]
MSIAESAPDTPTPAIQPVPAVAPRWLERLVRRPYALLALLGFLLWLPGILSLPALDRDESRFAQSSRQMVQSGDLVDIRFGQVPRYKKPAGIYWLQASSTALLGMGDDSRIWTYRVPSLLGAIAASWLTFWCAIAFAGSAAALLSGMLMLGTVLLTAEATIATTDAVLQACIVAVMAVLLRVYRAARDPDAPSPSTRMVMAGWTALALGVLVKGPVAPAVALAAIIGLSAWDREIKWLGALKPVRGFLLLLVLVMPWLVAITIQSNGAFFQQSLGDDFAAKLAGGQESHGAPPGYYLALSAAAFFPSILFVLPGVMQGIARRADPAIRFLLVWAASWWIVVEIAPTKLPHYVLPAYPALAILAALFVAAPQAVRGMKVARWIAAIQYLAGALLLAAAPVLLPHLYGAGATWWLMVLAASGLVLALAALALSVRRQMVTAVAAALLAMLVLVPTLTIGAAPRLAQLWVTERLKPLVAVSSRPGDPPPALAGYQEPSMLFALSKDVLLTDGKGAAEAGARAGGLALVEDQELGGFLARLAELQADAAPQAEVSGFNYSRGRKVHVTVFRVARLQDPREPRR